MLPLLDGNDSQKYCKDELGFFVIGVSVYIKSEYVLFSARKPLAHDPTTIKRIKSKRVHICTALVGDEDGNDHNA